MSKGDIGGYMSSHRTKGNINELKAYFNSVIDWVSSVFRDVEKEMQGLEWGRLYEQYHSKSYDPTKISAEVKRLYADPYIKKRRGVFEYVLDGRGQFHHCSRGDDGPYSARLKEAFRLPCG